MVELEWAGVVTETLLVIAADVGIGASGTLVLSELNPSIFHSMILSSLQA